MNRRHFLRLSASSLALAAGCPAMLRSAAAPAADTGPVVAGNTAFALDLYGQLKSKSGNLFYSPYSVSAALAMTSAGAAGDTLSEMTKVLHVNYHSFEHGTRNIDNPKSLLGQMRL